MDMCTAFCLSISKTVGLQRSYNQNSGVTRNLQSKENKESELKGHKIVIKSVITIYEKRTQI